MKASRILLTGALVATVTTTSPAHAQEQGRIAYLIGPSDLAANLDLVVRDIERKHSGTDERWRDRRRAR